MSISDDKSLYHCFSCGAGGDTIKFVSEIENIPYPEAIRKIVQVAGLNINVDSLLGRGDGRGYEEEQRHLALLKRAAEYYTQCILTDPRAGAARGELMRRRLNPESVFSFKIGYAPQQMNRNQSLLAILGREGFLEQDMVDTGLVVNGSDHERTNLYDRFRNRLMVPIRRPSDGAVVGFGGRILPNAVTTVTRIGSEPLPESSRSDAPKYLNSPETGLFKKNSILYGLDVAKKEVDAAGFSILVEGYFDVISLHDAGVRNAVGCLGTAVGVGHFQQLLRYTKAKECVLLLDADEAGIKAAERACLQVLPMLPAELEVRIGSLAMWKGGTAEMKDSSDLCMDAIGTGGRGGERTKVSAFIKEMAASAPGWKQWMLDRLLAPYTQVPDGRGSQVEFTRVVGDATAFIATALASSPADRTMLCYYCAERLCGGRGGLRLQLENDLLKIVDRKVRNGVVGGGGANKQWGPGQGVRPRSTPTTPRATPRGSSSGPQGRPVQLTEAATPASAMAMVSAPPAKAARAAPVAVPARTPAETKRALPGAGIYQEDPNQELASLDVASLFRRGVDLQAAKKAWINAPSAPENNGQWADSRNSGWRAVRERRSTRLWEGEQSTAQTEALHNSARLLTVPLGSSKRLIDSENLLLATYCHFPDLRPTVLQLLNRAHDSVGASSEFVVSQAPVNDISPDQLKYTWQHLSHTLLWSIICEQAETSADVAMPEGDTALELGKVLRASDGFTGLGKQDQAALESIIQGSHMRTRNAREALVIAQDASAFIVEMGAKRRQVELLQQLGQALGTASESGSGGQEEEQVGLRQQINAQDTVVRELTRDLERSRMRLREVRREEERSEKMQLRIDALDSAVTEDQTRILGSAADPQLAAMVSKLSLPDKLNELHAARLAEDEVEALACLQYESHEDEYAFPEAAPPATTVFSAAGVGELVAPAEYSTSDVFDQEQYSSISAKPKAQEHVAGAGASKYTFSWSPDDDCVLSDEEAASIDALSQERRQRAVLEYADSNSRTRGQTNGGHRDANRGGKKQRSGGGGEEWFGTYDHRKARKRSAQEVEEEEGDDIGGGWKDLGGTLVRLDDDFRIV
jgi:DNA primase catalytic core